MYNSFREFLTCNSQIYFQLKFYEISAAYCKNCGNLNLNKNSEIFMPLLLFKRQQVPITTSQEGYSTL